MRNLVRLTDWTRDDVAAVFALADAYRKGKGPRTEGAAVMFLPATSLRTRLTFERGADLMGLQPILFPPETLDKPESLVDVAGYLANWAKVLVVRHPDIGKLEALAAGRKVPVINAMTRVNHPCEVLSDAYALRQVRPDLRRLSFLFIGADGNIARAWQELAGVLGLRLAQCCPADLATPGLDWTDDLDVAITKADVVLTDAVGPHKRALAPYRVTRKLMDRAKPGVLFNPCPPFTRGNELSADAVASNWPFVGYGFKASLLPVQQAVMAHCLELG